MTDYSETLKATMLDYGAYQGDPSGAPAFNQGVVALFDAAINGAAVIDIGSSTLYALPALVAGEPTPTHAFRLTIIGTPAATATLIMPDSIRKHYLVFNLTGQAIALKYAASAGVLIGNGQAMLVECDGQYVRPFAVGYSVTTAETVAGVTIVDDSYEPGVVERYGNNVVPGTTDMSQALAAANAQAAETGGDPIRVKTVCHIGSATQITGKFEAVPGQQIFSPTSLVTFAAGTVDAVYPDWWGSASGAINKAVAAVTGKYIPVRLLAKTYAFATGLALINHGDAIIGPSRGNATTGGVFAGAVLDYTGTSIAIQCGVAPSVNGTLLYQLELGGFTLKVTENTNTAVHLWHVSSMSRVHDITIRGSSDNDGSDNWGLLLEGCVDMDIERVLVYGQGLLGATTTLLQRGVLIINGFSSSPTVDVRLHAVNATQCRDGIFVGGDSRVVLSHSAATNCYDSGLVLNSNAKVTLVDPHINGNGASGAQQIRLEGAGCALSMQGGVVSAGTAQYLIALQADAALTLLGNTEFISTHGSPRLIFANSNQPTVHVLGQNTYPASVADSDTAITKFFKVQNGIPKAPSYTVAGLPATPQAGTFVYVSNAAGGAILAFGDGTNWRRTDDRAVVS